MDSFIKKIFSGVRDNFVHLQFQKFSKGEFKDRAMINVSKSKDMYSISTTSEYANEFVRSIAEKIPSGEKVKVTGVVVSTRDLTGEISFKSKKQFMGIKQYVMDDSLSKEEIISMCDKLPNSFLGLSFSVKGTELKIKPKAPKSAKPSTSEKGPKVDFCKIKTSDEKLVNELLFDVRDFKKVEIGHDFIITDLEIPKDEKDPLKMRENTIRKGKIIRRIKKDGQESIKESKFEA